jgi:FecR protein
MFRVPFLFPLLFVLSTPAFAASVGRVQASAGSTVLIHAGASAAPAPGTALEANDIVRTGAGASARLVLTDGSALLMDQNTELRVVAHDTDKQITLIELLHGHIRAITTPVVKPGGIFQVHTPTAQVVALGTAFDVQTGATAPVSGPAISIADNGQPVSGADVALQLANLNKFSLGTTDSTGKTSQTSVLDLANGAGGNPALDLANLGKVSLHAEVDQCSNGAQHVYLVGPDGKLPPPAADCKRKRLTGDFFWTTGRKVVIDTTLGTLTSTAISTITDALTNAQTNGASSTATDTATTATANSTGTVANTASSTTASTTSNFSQFQTTGTNGSYTTPLTGPQSLTDIPAGTTPGTATATSIGSYTGVQTTQVFALNHYVGVANIDTGVSGVTYLLPGEGTFISRGEPPTAAVDVRQKEFTDNLFHNVLYHAEHPDLTVNTFTPNTFGFEKTFLDANGSGSMCMPALVVNGNPITGEGLSTPAFHYTLLGLGTSTGNALHLQVFNDGQCALYFMVTDGSVFAPHGFTEKFVLSILSGSIPTITDFQKMISMGGMIYIPGGSVLGAGPAVPPASAMAEVDLRSYCVQLHKLAPHPKTEYRFGPPEDQQSLGTNRPIVDKVFSMIQTGALKVPTGSNMDGIIQYSLWTKIEQMTQKQFMDEYKLLVHKNYDAQKKKFDKAAETAAETSGQDLYAAVQKVIN